MKLIRFPDESETPLDRARRRFIGSTVVTSIGVLAAPTALAAALPTKRALSLFNTHTKEQLTTAYYDAGSYQKNALADVDHLLRDHRTGEVHRMDIALLDLLHDLFLETGSRGTFEVISGYRSPTTNRMLRTGSGGVAKNSLHMHGKAIDVRLSDIDTTQLRDIATAKRRGGVGYYRDSNFVHLDVGRFRTW